MSSCFWAFLREVGLTRRQKPLECPTATGLRAHVLDLEDEKRKEQRDT
jgi:hypothetical protein